MPECAGSIMQLTLYANVRHNRGCKNKTMNTIELVLLHLQYIRSVSVKQPPKADIDRFQNAKIQYFAARS